MGPLDALGYNPTLPILCSASWAKAAVLMQVIALKLAIGL